MKFKQIVISWDFLLTLLILVITYVFVPEAFANNLMKDVYNMGISVLAIVFSVYFAALAIIISASDNEFIKFLEAEGGLYIALIRTFRYSLILLFVALMLSIFLFIYTSHLISEFIKLQPVFLFLIFLFFFIYGLFASASSTLDAINYAKYRTQFGNLKQNK
ncbi:MAG: hypothetical protein SCALA702_01200 [Melioribacteraceae bacterium]|nr:MAG: hypothetical protein SCALA702_01200 [Melioribacteraceae bacterium]